MENRHGELAQPQDPDLESHRHDGTGDAGRIRGLRRASVPHARRGPVRHGTEGHIVLDKYPGEWEAMPSYIEAPRPLRASGFRSASRTGSASICRPSSRSSSTRIPRPASRSPSATELPHRHATGAAAAVSVKWMARSDAQTLAIVGAGHMAQGTLATCHEVVKWRDVRV